MRFSAQIRSHLTQGCLDMEPHTWCFLFGFWSSPFEATLEGIPQNRTHTHTHKHTQTQTQTHKKHAHNHNHKHKHRRTPGEAFYLPAPCEFTFANTLLLSNAAISLGHASINNQISSEYIMLFTLWSFLLSDPFIRLHIQ